MIINVDSIASGNFSVVVDCDVCGPTSSISLEAVDATSNFDELGKFTRDATVGYTARLVLFMIFLNIRYVRSLRIFNPEH